MSELFTVAGTATNPDGETKVRFANDLVTRIKILVKANCTNIEMFELPEPMTKLDALRWLAAKGLKGDADFVVSYKLGEKLKADKKAGVTSSKVRSLDELKAAAQKVKATA